MSQMMDRMREGAFWTLDALRGGSVRRNYQEVEAVNRDPLCPASLQIRNDRLQSLLEYVTRNVAFYRDWAGSSQLAAFPVVDKNTLKAGGDQVLSDDHGKKKLHRVMTSGSTGTPFLSLHDQAKRRRHQADNIFYLEQAGHRLGRRLYYLRVWNELVRKSFITGLAQNIVMEDSSDLSDPSLELFLGRLRADRSDKSVLGFASTYEAIARYLERRPADLSGIGVTSLITMSEALPDRYREVLRDAFKCPVVSRYSNNENGFLAQQYQGDGSDYHLNLASYHIELLRFDKDEPVPEGELGRIVVTDLCNWTMPFIRYDTGDAGVMSSASSQGRTAPVLTRVEGRRVEFLFDTRGHLKSPHNVTNMMWRYPMVRQFQFIQEGERTYTMKLNCSDRQFPLADALVADLKACFGQDAGIALDYVDEIPLLASGKLKKIVNRYRIL